MCVCVRIILKQRSESLRASTLGTEIREATPVPCHHPKTELLQNILKCLRDLDTEIKKKKKCEKKQAVEAQAVRKDKGQTD